MSSLPSLALRLALVVCTGAVGWVLGGRAADYFLAAEPMAGWGSRVAGGPWRFSEKVGKPAASHLERARLALSGPLGLSASEAVYFIARADEDGEALRSSCGYKISGESFDARWWSLTVYDAETFRFVSDHAGRASWTGLAPQLAGNQRWTINVGPAPLPEPWISSRDEPPGRLELLLRIYNPSDATRAQLPALALPTIEKTGC